MQKYLAEALGTGLLALIVGLSLSGSVLAVSPLLTGALAALIVGVFVYAVGGISGSHLNPAVTLGVLAIGKISRLDAIIYIIAQVIGAVVALVILQTLTLAPQVGAESTVAAGFAEFLGTFVLTFGVAAVIMGRISSSATGIMVAIALFIGVVFSVLLGANGVINPVIAFVIGSFNLAYFFGQIFGGVLGFLTFRYLQK